MNAEIAHQHLLRSTLVLFPREMNSPEARAMILAICLQESDFEHRIQLIGNHRKWWESIKGPARGWPQFERIGIQGVLEHPATRDMARGACDVLGYPPDVATLHEAVAHNDILAVALARLALWRLPRPLPGKDYPDEAWSQYVEAWAPGKPKPDRWRPRYALAWRIVERSSWPRS